MQFAEWHRSAEPIDDEPIGCSDDYLEEQGESLGAEILDSSLEYVGDVGRDPFGGAWPMNVND